MTNLFYGLEHSILLQVVGVLLGLATFVGFLVFFACPRCSWAEWVGEGSVDDDDA